MRPEDEIVLPARRRRHQGRNGGACLGKGLFRAKALLLLVEVGVGDVEELNPDAGKGIHHGQSCRCSRVLPPPVFLLHRFPCL